jgi:hypothetical protein
LAHTSKARAQAQAQAQDSPAKEDGGAPSDEIEVAWREALDLAQQHYTAEELDARQRARRLASQGKEANVRADDVQPYLQHAVYALGTSRRAHTFLNRLRWLSLSARHRLQQAMRDDDVAGVTYVPGSMLDVFHRQIGSASGARRTSRQGVAAASAARAQAASLTPAGRNSLTRGAYNANSERLGGQAVLGQGEAEVDLESQPSFAEVSAEADATAEQPLPYVTSAGSARVIVRKGLPRNHSSLKRLRPWLELLASQLHLDLQQAGTPAEQLELFFRAKGLFQTVFPEQSAAWRWLAPKSRAAHGDGGIEGDGTTPAGTAADSGPAGRHELRRAEWVKRLPKLVPDEDIGQARRAAHLLNTGYNPDALLQTENEFAKMDDADYVLLRLRRRGDTIDTSEGYDVMTMRSLAVASYREGSHLPEEVWGSVYAHGPGGTARPTINLESLPEDEGTTYSGGFDGGRGGRRRAREGIMAYLLLRHLRVRGLRQEALGLLNFCSSLQRTLAFELATVPPDGARADEATSNAAAAAADEFAGAAGAGGFLEDRYEIREGQLYVLDASGSSVVYDHAVTSLERLEHELLALGSHYLRRTIQGQQDILEASLRRQSLAAPSGGDGGADGYSGDETSRPTSRQARRPSRPNSAARPRSNSLLRAGRRESTMTAGRPGSASCEPEAGIDLTLFGKGEVDRAAVLLELWLWEVEFLREKQRLLDCYRTALQHTTHLSARRRLVQVMVNLLNRRPHYDFEASYFASSYHAACVSLRMERQMLVEVLNYQIEGARQATAALAVTSPHSDPADTAATGLPLPTAALNPAVATSAAMSWQVGQPSGLPILPTLFHEMCSTAEVLAAIPAAMRFAFEEALRVLRPESALQESRLQAAICHEALLAWRQESQEQAHSQLMSDALVHLNEKAVADNAIAVAQVSVKVAATSASAARERGSLPDAVGMVAAAAMYNAVEFTQQRHRLLLAHHESALLTQLYRGLCAELGLGEHHAFVRPMTFSGTNAEGSAEKKVSGGGSGKY